MKVGKEIALEAKKKGICKEWFSDMLKLNDVKPLCEMYFRGDDWAMENDFPDLSILRKFKGNSDKYGLHTDFEGEISNQHQTALFGNSVGTLNYDGYFAGNLIVRHNSKANIVVKDNAFLIVNILDNAEVRITTYGNGKAIVYNYHSTSVVMFDGNVEVKQANFEK